MIHQRSTGMYYIGKSNNVKYRISQHIKCGEGSSISRAISEFGVDDFTVDVEYFPNFASAELRDLEYEMIKCFGSIVPTGYNKRCRGSKNIMTAETRERMSIAKKGKKKSSEHCEKISAALKGRKHSPVTRKKMSIARKGRQFSPEHCEKLSLAAKKRWM